MLRSVALALVFLTAAWGQTRSDPRRGLPEIDVREQNSVPEVQPSAQQTRARALVERRTSDLEAFKAARAAAQPGVRIVPNRHGLPKLFVRRSEQAKNNGTSRRVNTGDDRFDGDAWTAGAAFFG